MKLHWFVPSLIGAVCLTAAPPAEAGQLTAWQYKSGQNQLEFTTDEGVQPRAQLVFDPARLVIDLPGTTIGAVSTAQVVGSGIQQIRLGQFDGQTTRIVIELSPGYTLDPGQIHFRGLSPTQWTVQLPSPQLTNASANSSDASERSVGNTFKNPANSTLPNASIGTASNSPDSNTSTSPSFSSTAPTLESSALNPTASFRSPGLTAPSSTSSSASTAFAPFPTSTPAQVASSPRSPLLPAQSSPAQSSPAPLLSVARSPQLMPQASIQTVSQPVSQPRLQPAAPAPISASPISTAASATTSASTRTSLTTQVDAVQVTDRGLFISTQRKAPEVAVDRSRNRRSVVIRLSNAQLSPQLVERERRINRYGIERFAIEQNGTQVKITLDVSRRSPDWQAQMTNQGGVVLVPATEVAAEPKLAETAPTVPTAAPSTAPMVVQTAARSINNAEQPSLGRISTNDVPRMQFATVQGIELDLSGNQLLIQTDRPVSHQAQWQSGMYVITLSPAQLADRVTGPQLSGTAPLRRVRLRQVNDQTVSISIQPASGVQFGALNLITPQMLALEMQTPVPRPISSSTPVAPLTQPLPSVTPNGRVVVAIDPGHGGRDVGAVGIGGIQEADIVLSIAQQVATILQQQGIQVILTRSNDVEIDLQPRVDTAEQARANLFVSIHANSMGMDRPDINGIETYYYSNGAALAQVMQNSIVSGTGMQDRGVQQARFYVLRKSSMPAILIETGFVTGSQDAARLASSSFQKQMATAIARGVLQYIQQQATVGSR